MEVTAGENVISNITTNVEDGILKLDNTNKCNFVRGYKRKVKIKISVPYVEKVTNHGVGPITLSDNFQQDKIFVRAENSGDIHVNGTFDELRTSSHGNGDMYLNGSTRRLLVYTNGTNYTWAEELLISEYIFVSTYSIGDVFFNLSPTIKLDYYIWSDGNIYYKGNSNSISRLNEDVSKGKLIKQD